MLEEELELLNNQGYIDPELFEDLDLESFEINFRKEYPEYQREKSNEY